MTAATKEKDVAGKVVRKRKPVEDDEQVDDRLAGLTKEMQEHPLAHLIPPEYYAEDYVPRRIGGVPDLKVFEYAHQKLHNTILRGPTGSAKTSAIYAYAAGGYDARWHTEDGYTVGKTLVNRRKARPVVYVPCNGAIDPSQLLGRWVPRATGGFKFVPGELVLAVLYGAIIYFDEVNFMPPKIGAVAHGLLDKRRVIVVLDANGSGLCANCGYMNETVEPDDEGSVFDIPECASCGELVQSTQFTAADDTQVFAAYNADYEGTVPLNEAFLNRFAMKVEWPYLRDVELQMVNSPQLLELAAQLRDAHANNTIRTPISTNMLLEFEELALEPMLSLGFAMENFLNAFHAEEREAVRHVLEAHTPKIREELAKVDLDAGE